MEQEIIERLLGLNREFYERFADDFAATRQPQQPGLQRLLSRLPPTEGSWLLDVGCGNGRFAHLLDHAGHRLHYVGVDANRRLLELARGQAMGLQSVRSAFIQRDITSPDWMVGLPHRPFQTIVVLAVLHHMPSWELRRDLLAQLRALLSGNGCLAVSTWQFLNEERLRRKIVPWERAGLTQADLEPGDYLLDWQRGGAGLRYCHLVDEEELLTLAERAGFTPREMFYADGQRGNLNLFGLLRPAVQQSQQT